MKVYGITGGIGAGKSAVTLILRDLGYTVVDLDQVARKVVEPGAPGLAAISDLFGAAYLNLDGTLNRKMLASLVFNDDAELAKLDMIMGPLLGAEMQRQLAEVDSELAFVDGALIIEKGMHHQFAGTILVTAPVSVRVGRAMQRDGAAVEEVRARVESQMPDAAKLRFVDFVIDNSGTMHELHDKVVSVVEELKR